MSVKRSLHRPALGALVLAAGRGARFGGAKLTAPWRGGVVLDGALASAFAAPAETVTLVAGASADRVAEAARAFAARMRRTDRLRLVEATDWAEGLSASLKAGLASLPRGTSAAYVFLGDMPRVPVEVLGPLADAVAAGAPAAVPVFAGQAGHPALIGAALFPRIAELAGDRGARSVLEALGPALARIETDDDGVLFDVDTPAALAG